MNLGCDFMKKSRISRAIELVLIFKIGVVVGKYRRAVKI
jgi:hypothetical protein